MNHIYCPWGIHARKLVKDSGFHPNNSRIICERFLHSADKISEIRPKLCVLKPSASMSSAIAKISQSAAFVLTCVNFCASMSAPTASVGDQMPLSFPPNCC